MEAIREIKIAHRHQLTIEVPDEFLEREVEIIVLPLGDEKKTSVNNRKESFLEFAQSFQLKLPQDYLFNREELYDHKGIS